MLRFTGYVTAPLRPAPSARTAGL